MARRTTDRDAHDDIARLRAARERMRAGRFDEALAELDRLSDDPRAQRVQETLRQQIGEKLRIYAPPHGAPPTSTSFADDFVRFEHDGIVLCFHLENPRLALATLHRSVRRARRTIATALGLRLEMIEVDLFDTPSELDERLEQAGGPDRPEWAAGIADGRIRVTAASPGAPEPQHLEALLTHEVAHLVVGALAENRCPRWLDEGIALQFSHGLSDRYLTGLNTALREERTLPLAILAGNFGRLRSQALVRLAYAQASSTVTFLVESRGWAVIRSLLADIGRRGYEGALVANGLDEYLIEREWTGWARGRV